MYSKYERRTDTRTYEDRRKLYEGGWEVVRAEHLQAAWKEKYDEWLKRPKSKLFIYLYLETNIADLSRLDSFLIREFSCTNF